MTNTVHVNVGGTWKTATNYYVNVSGTWKTGSAIAAKISSVWEEGTSSLVSTNLKLHLDAGDSTSYGGSGTAWSDLTSEDNDATISGATYSSSDGGILDFDGTDDYAVTAHSSDFEFGSGDFTIEAWFYPESSSSSGLSVVSIWNYNDGKRAWSISGVAGSSSTIRGMVSPDGAWATRTEIQGSVTQNEWNHVVFTRISNTLTLYIDNSSEGTASFTGSVYSNTTDGLLVGAQGAADDVNNQFNGKISQVRIYKGTGLTSTQVAQNYNATKATFGL